MHMDKRATVLPRCLAKTAYTRDLLKSSVLAGASALGLSMGSSTPALAAACGANLISIAYAGSCQGPAVYNTSISNVTNNGTISNGNFGIIFSSGGAIGTLTNNGTINAVGSAIQIANGGSIGAIVNNGYIHSPNGNAIAVLSDGSMTTLTNTGTIYGGIVKRGTGELVITGVTDGSDNFGTLTSGNSRSIESTISGLRFAGGNSLVDINIDVGTQTVTNAGASLKFIRDRSITGNLTQNSGSLIFNALSATTFPQLSVSGSAALSGGTIVLVPISGQDATGTYTIISANGGISSSANALAAGYTVATSISGNNLLLTLTSAPAAGGGGPVWTVRAQDAGGKAVPIGPVLDTLSADSNFTELLAALTLLSSSDQNTALAQLGTPQVVLQGLSHGASLELSTRAIDQRQMALLAGVPSGLAAGEAIDGSGVWLQLLGNRASLNHSTTSSGFQSSAHGLSIGADTYLSTDVIGGLAFSWVHSDLNGNGQSRGSDAEVDSYQIAAYGSWRPHGGAVFFNGLLSVGRNDFTQSRSIDFLSSKASAHYKGWQSQIKLGAGIDFPLNEAITLTPLASIQAARIENDGYQEKNAGVANLKVKRQGFNSVESELGIKLSAYTETEFGRLSGDWQTGWLHSFNKDSIATTATLGGVNFVTKTDRLAADGAHVALRATLQRPDNISFSVEYDGMYRSKFDSHTASVRVRYDF